MRVNLRGIRSGVLRDDRLGPMQVVFGPIGRERIHYEAPPAPRLEREMAMFLGWFEATDSADPVLRAALAHLWFVTIHPFDDGNGRIARVISEMALARSEGIADRFYSTSAQIRGEREAYYDILEHTQKGTLDITKWMTWFLICLDRAFDRAETTLEVVLNKARFWEAHAAEIFNEQQRKVLNILLDGLDGSLTSTRWARITNSSQDTALRDLNDLVSRDILIKNPAGGRSTSYSLRA